MASARGTRFFFSKRRFIMGAVDNTSIRTRSPRLALQTLAAPYSRLSPALTPSPLDTRNSMHLVLRSSRAKGEWSFRRGDNSRRVKAILEKFSAKYAVKIYSLANVGNHLHLHIRLNNRHGYKPFIRAVTAAIAMAITGASRWQKAEVKFWDLRPYTRVVVGRKAWDFLVRYIRINQWEGFGVGRELAVYLADRPRLSSA